MVLKDIKNKKIIIKTYLFESGLWYLAKSLGDTLVSNGNEVLYLSKEKYSKSGEFPGRFKTTYPNSNDLLMLDGLKTFTPSAGIRAEEEVINLVSSFGADILISFETFMRKAQWVRNLKAKTGVYIIDVPMSEWTSPRYLNNMSYNIFDEIWCLTDFCKSIFSAYSHSIKMEWDFIKKEAFEPSKDLDRLTFYHQASIDSSYDNKNTDQVIDAFCKFCEKVDESPLLVVSGNLTKKQKNMISNNDAIVHTGFVDRQDIVELYNKANCIIAPSKKEGLGLSFFEAKASKCSIITTDAPPMNEHSDYLCKVIAYNRDETSVPSAITGSKEILEQILKFYGEYKMSNKASAKDIKIEKKKKSKSEIDSENDSLLAAFEDSGSKSSEPNEESLDASVLEKLKGKMNKPKEDEKVPSVTSKRSVSIELAVIGVGQAGSRIAEVMHKNGYDVGVINTSSQDLEFIDVLPMQKLLLEGSLGGTGKDLDLGREIFEENEDKLASFVSGVVEGNHMVYLAISGGGGTGSSSVDVMTNMLFETGLPVGVIYVLPKATEDAQSKRNSIETLSRLARMTADNMISNLIVADNARIEQIYANLSQAKFWEVSNNAIVEPLHVFNTLTSKASRHTSMDPSDFGKVISCGDCSIYGLIEVDDYMEETALAEAVIESLDSNMLASGFDLEQTRYGGVIIAANNSVLEKLPSININYCFHMISEKTSGASIYQGVYDVESDKDSVKIYSWFAGLGLPRDRIENLKQESKVQSEVAMQKEKSRAAAMTLDLNEDRVNSVTDQVHRKIQKKKSGFNKLQRGSIIDKRRKR